MSTWWIWMIENPSLTHFCIFSISFTWTDSGLLQLETWVKCWAPSTSIIIFLESETKSKGMKWLFWEKRPHSKRFWVLHSPSSFFRKARTFASVFFLQYGHQYPVKTLYNLDEKSEWHISPHKNLNFPQHTLLCTPRSSWNHGGTPHSDLFSAMQWIICQKNGRFLYFTEQPIVNS